jgi:tRNA-intron endonuclease
MGKRAQGEARVYDNKAIVESRRLRDQLIQRGFGERVGKHLVLELCEALYLLEKNKLTVLSEGGRKMKPSSLLRYARAIEPRFYTRYLVFKDLRDKGYVVKTGFKFGFHFRVYPKGKKPGEEHSAWVVWAVTQDESFTMPELSRMVRLAGNLNTQLLIAVVDAENDINYYLVERHLP